jgi:hypothetical protein
MDPALLVGFIFLESHPESDAVSPSATIRAAEEVGFFRPSKHYK